MRKLYGIVARRRAGKIQILLLLALGLEETQLAQLLSRVKLAFVDILHSLMVEKIHRHWIPVSQYLLTATEKERERER